MRELIDKFNKNDNYIFKIEYTTLNSPIYQMVDGHVVHVVDDGCGIVIHKSIGLFVTPNMCKKI